MMKEQIIKTAELIKELYNSNDGGVGGYGHIVFDEDNLETHYVEWCIEEAKKGKLCVMLLPVSTSTKLFHEFIKPNAKEIRFIERRLPFIGTTIDKKTGETVWVNWKHWDKKPPIGVRESNNSGMHDSMIVILKN